MKGYQFLENDFFDLCRKRRIKPISMLLLIYLRGLYRYFGKAKFYWKDSQTIEHLRISRPTLRQARNRLKERGIIDFNPGISRFSFTEYSILQTILASNLTMKKNDPTMKESFTVNRAQRGTNLSQSVYKSKEIKPLYKELMSIRQRKYIAPKGQRHEQRTAESDKAVARLIGRRRKKEN